MLGIDILIVVFGLGVGVLVGLTGIGGGALMTPLLVLFGGISPVVAIGTDLAYGAVTKTVGGWKHLRSGLVDLGVSKWLAVGSVPGSLLGVFAVDRLHARYGDGIDDALLISIAVALVIVAATVLTRALFMPKLAERERESVGLTRRTKSGAIAIGFTLGAIVGLTSVGSGALIGLALILIFRLTPHRVVGTDVFHAAILLWVAAIAHGIGGNVDLLLMANILIGSLPGVWVGTALLTRVPAHGLRPVLGCVLLASALGVSTKAGLELPAWGILAPPLAVGAFAYLLHRSRVARGLTPAPQPASEAAPA